MTAVWMRVRADLARRWPAVVLLAVLVGVAGGVVLTAAAGARRTSTSFDRFVAESRPGHVDVELGRAPARLVDRIEALPQVEALAHVVPVHATLESTDVFVPIGASVDGNHLRDLDRPRVLDGRLPDPDAADEVILGESTAVALDAGVGDTVRLRTFTPAQVSLLLEDETAVPEPAGPRVPLRVVGVGRVPGDLNASGREPTALVLQTGFLRRYRDEVGTLPTVLSGNDRTVADVLRVRLAGGAADLPAFVDAVEGLLGARGEVNFAPLTFESARVEDSLDVLTVGLGLFAAVAGLAGLVAVGLAVVRLVSGASDEHSALRALGMTGRQRQSLLLTPVAVGALAGGVLAVGIAVAASPLMPIGLARRAEPVPGVSFDAAVLGLGFVAVTAIVLALGAAAAWREARRAVASDVAAGAHPSAVVRRLAAWGATPSAVTGVRMALERGRGRTAVPVRTAVLGAAAGVAGLIAVIVFAASLDRLLTTPSRYGWNWDVRAGGPRLHSDDLVAEPATGAVAEARFTDIEVAGRPVDAVGVEQLERSVFLTIVAGRAPRGADEVVLGAETMRDADVEIGDRIAASGPLGRERFTVVGRAVFPPVDDNAVLADGAAFTEAGLRSLVANDDRGEGGFRTYLVELTPGVEEAAARRAIEVRAGEPTESADLPIEVERLTQTERLPHVLAAFVGLLAVLALGYALVTAVSRRRRDLAVLKTLGFTRRSVSAAVAWQATTVALIGLAIGIPAGIVLGRWSWALVADGLGIATDALVPRVALVVVALGAVAVANLVAAVPARGAARIRPAAVLRSE